MTKFSKFLVILFVLFAAGKTYAACSVNTTGVSFGNYDIVAPVPLDSTGTISITCDEVPPSDVTISMGPSVNSGIFNPRQMKHITGADLLNYNLFTKQSRTTVWGDGTGGTTNVVIKGTKKRTVTIYGSIPPKQNVTPGTYGDILTVTITP